MIVTTFSIAEGIESNNIVKVENNSKLLEIKIWYKSKVYVCFSLISNFIQLMLYIIDHHCDQLGFSLWKIAWMRENLFDLTSFRFDYSKLAIYVLLWYLWLLHWGRLTLDWFLEVLKPSWIARFLLNMETTKDFFQLLLPLLHY
jgi:hypothetical protein